MSELELFEFLKTHHVPDLKKSANQFERTDCVSDAARWVIELKCRRTHYEELLIEKKKFDALIARADELEYLAIYVNSTPLGIYLWNVYDDGSMQWHQEQMPSTTDFSNGNKVNKIVGYLPISKAVHLSGAMDYKRLDK